MGRRAYKWRIGGWCRLERCKRDIIGGLCGHHAGRWCSLRPELHLCKRVRGRSCFIYRVVLRCWLRGVCAKINKLCEMLTLDCSCVKGRGRSRRSQSNLYIRLPFFSLFCVSAACAARFTFFSRTAPPFFEKWGAVHKSGELGGVPFLKPRAENGPVHLQTWFQWPHFTLVR